MLHVSGYLSGADLAGALRFPAAEPAGQYWIRSGIAGFAPDAAQHFYLPERYTDPFGNVTTLEYDPLDLFVASSTDALGNTTRVTRFDFRVLAPREMQDINDNLSEVFFDVLGLPAAMAVKGKGNEGDNLAGFDDALANPELADLTAFFTDASLRRGVRHDAGWATPPPATSTTSARHAMLDGSHHLGHTPAVRLRHRARDAREPACAGRAEPAANRLRVLRRHGQRAGEESPGGARGRRSNHCAGSPAARPSSTTRANRSNSTSRTSAPSRPPASRSREDGVTPVIYYDAVGRTVRTEMPDGTFSRVEFSPWHVAQLRPERHGA